jgi:hypothetical protein
MMIKGINSNSQYINVNQGYPTNMPYINVGSLSAGSLRFNPSNQNMEVYDGNSWMPIMANYATVDLPDWVKATLDWAHQRMTDERNLEYLCAKYPGLEKARDNFELFKKFVRAQEDVDDGQPVANSGVSASS